MPRAFAPQVKVVSDLARMYLEGEANSAIAAHVEDRMEPPSNVREGGFNE